MFGKGASLATQHSVGRYHERSEVTALLEARCEILPFLLFFLGFEDAGWVSGLVGVGIRIRHSDVYDALGPTGPKASEQDVATIILFRWLLVAGLTW